MMRLFLTLCILFYSWTCLSNEKPFSVIIDPGHGGSDSGAIQNKIKESDVVLSISQQVLSKLHEKYPLVSARLTRNANKFLSLEDRIHLKEENTDLFVSLHANSSTSKYVQGMEVYFQPDQNKQSDSVVQAITADLESIGKSKKSLLFAKNLQSSWTLSNSVIRRSSFFVVEKSEFPSVLVELGFLSNPKEAEKLNSAAYQSLVAETIVNSIIEYKNSIQ